MTPLASIAVTYRLGRRVITLGRVTHSRKVALIGAGLCRRALARRGYNVQPPP